MKGIALLALFGAALAHPAGLVSTSILQPEPHWPDLGIS